jgi:hypothetical protein
MLRRVQQEARPLAGLFVCARVMCCSSTFRTAAAAKSSPAEAIPHEGTLGSFLQNLRLAPMIANNLQSRI